MSKALDWFADFAAEKNLNNKIIFHGGEPALIPPEQYRRCIEKLLYKRPDMNFKFLMQTNGFMLSDKIIELMRDFDMNIGISLDGPQEVHDFERRTLNNKNSFKRIINNINKLIIAGIKTSALMVMTRRAINFNLSWLKDFKDLNINLKINPLLNIGKARSHSELALCPGDYADFLIKVYEYILDNEINISLTPLESLLGAAINNINLRECIFSDKCHDNFICINQDGEIYPCGRFADEHEYKLGNIYDGINDSGREILRQLKARRSFNMPLECQECSFKNICHAGCSCGAFNKPSEMCHDYKKLFNYMQSAGIKKYKEYLLKRREYILNKLNF